MIQIYLWHNVIWLQRWSSQRMGQKQAILESFFCFNLGGAGTSPTHSKSYYNRYIILRTYMTIMFILQGSFFTRQIIFILDHWVRSLSCPHHWAYQLPHNWKIRVCCSRSTPDLVTCGHLRYNPNFGCVYFPLFSGRHWHWNDILWGKS